MTLTFQASGIAIPLNETEALTQEKWSDLVEAARRQKVPYFTAALCYLKGKVLKVYDGIFLDRYLKQNPAGRDPLTRRTIERVEYQFLKLSHIARKAHACRFKSFKIDESLNCNQLAFEATNYHATKKPQKRKTAICQFVVGAKLYKSSHTNLERRESFRWLKLSALNGCPQAINFIRK